MSLDKRNVGPLWGFFQFIRDKSAIPLSIDQYFYLVRAIHKFTHKDLITTHDLLQFTKIFWLNDSKFEFQYDYFFNNFFDWENYFAPEDDKRKQQSSGSTQPKSTTGPEYQDEHTDIRDEGEPPQPEEQLSNAGTAKEPIVDFQIVLRDSTFGPTDQEAEIANLDHSFSLSDLTIMPFDARKFVQRLRRKVETAEQVQSDTIDVTLMVEDFIGSGFIEKIIYETADASHSNVVLLEDRFGSMLAYEYLESHFSQALGQIPYCDFQHYFFYNLPEVSKEQGHFLLPVAGKNSKVLNTQKHDWNQKTWFFILSDAGAHSGLVNRERIKASLKMWHYFNAISKHVYWINPVPFEYLNDCTAKRLQMAIPMINPDLQSLNRMVLMSKSVDQL